MRLSFHPQRKHVIRVAAGTLAIAVLCVFAAKTLIPKAETTELYSSEAAEKRSIQNVLSATGTLAPLSTYNVTTLVSGEVTQADFSEGDVVQKGQLLYAIDQSAAQSSIDRARLSLQKSQLSYEQQVEGLGDLTIKSDNAGTIIGLKVAVGDTVQEGSEIATLRDSATMLIKAPFNEADAVVLSVGQGAIVTLDGSFETLSGTVTEIDGANTVLDGYQTVRYITVAVQNPGALSPTAAGSVSIGGVAGNSGASFTYNEERKITAETSGKITALSVREGSTVTSGQTVATLSSTSLENQIENAKLSVTDSEIALQSTVDTLDDYSITAPIGGTVVTKSAKVGDSIGSSGGSSGVSTLAVIYDLTALTFDIALDELDISKVAVGQSVEVTADALAGEIFTGIVTKVSVAGTTTNGSTTYPVTVEIQNPPAQLLPGMNINATIIVEHAENALSIPAAAVQRGDVVYVKGSTQANADAGASANERIPEGFYSVKVETGIASDNYIEILSGLQEGDIVYVPAVVKSSGENTQMVMMGSPAEMGGGGPPSGAGGGMQP